MSAIKRLSIFPQIFFKADPLEAQISLFNLILVAGTYQKKQAKEKRYRRRNKSCQHDINMYLFNKKAVFMLSFQHSNVQEYFDNP